MPTLQVCAENGDDAGAGRLSGWIQKSSETPAIIHASLPSPHPLTPSPSPSNHPARNGTAGSLRNAHCPRLPRTGPAGIYRPSAGGDEISFPRAKGRFLDRGGLSIRSHAFLEPILLEQFVKGRNIFVPPGLGGFSGISRSRWMTPPYASS